MAEMSTEYSFVEKPEREEKLCDLKSRWVG
jgi:hypothetical protein